LERARKMLFARQDREMKKRIRFLKNNGLLDGLSRKEIKNEGNKSEDDKKVGGCEKCRSCGEEKTDTRSGSKEVVLPDSKTY